MSDSQPAGLAPRYRDLTDEEVLKIYGARFDLEELIQPNDEDTLEEALTLLIHKARWRVVDVFAEERERYRGKERRTDNYIALDSDDLSDLVKYVLIRMRRAITSRRSLAKRFQDVSPIDQENLCKNADEQLVVAALLQMCETCAGELWYDHGRQVWQLCQSCCEEQRLERRHTKRTLRGVKGFYDSRTYHGRNGKQARGRDRQNGNAYRSTGFASQVH